MTNEIKADSSVRVRARKARDSKGKTNSGRTRGSKSALKIATWKRTSSNSVGAQMPTAMTKRESGSALNPQ